MPRLIDTQSRASRYGRRRSAITAPCVHVLRALQLEQVGELEPRRRGLPQTDRRCTCRGVENDRAEEALGPARVVDEVGEEQRRHAVAAGGHDPVVLGAHLVVGGRIGDRLVDHGRVESDLPEQVPGDLRIVGTVSVLVQCSTGAFVPSVEVVHARTSKQRPDAHHRPAVRPLALPRVLLAVDPVDLLQAEELPVDHQIVLTADLSDPLRRLVGERAHHIEVEVDAGHAHGIVRHVQRWHTVRVRAGPAGGDACVASAPRRRTR